MEALNYLSVSSNCTSPELEIVAPNRFEQYSIYKAFIGEAKLRAIHEYPVELSQTKVQIYSFGFDVSLLIQSLVQEYAEVLSVC